MAGFDNKKTASEAGAKSKRGPAKTTQETRRVLTEVMGGQLDNIESALDDLYKRDKLKYLQVMQNLMQYAVPKLTDNNHNLSNEQQVFEFGDGQSIKI
jgi:hypothetical protein